MSSSVSVKSSPDKASTDLFVLHEGTKVRTVSELGDWREIVIADGKKGWVEGPHDRNDLTKTHRGGDLNRSPPRIFILECLNY